MNKVRKCIILSMLSLFIFSNNVTTSSANEIVNNQNITTDKVKIPISGFIGNTEFESTIPDAPDNSNPDAPDNSNPDAPDNRPGIDKLPQTGNEVLFWSILLAIFMIILGAIVQNKSYKKEKHLRIDK